MYDLENNFLHIYRSQGMSDLRLSGGNYDLMFINKSYTVKLDFCSDSKSNLDDPTRCPLIIVLDKC